jgi:hypothetical protein
MTRVWVNRIGPGDSTVLLCVLFLSEPTSVCGVNCSTVLLSSPTTGYFNLLSSVLSTIAAQGRAVLKGCGNVMDVDQEHAIKIGLVSLFKFVSS